MNIFSKELLMQVYEPNTLIAEYTSAGTYSLEIKGSGLYDVEAISGGASGKKVDSGTALHYYYHGGTGAYYKGILRLKNDVYTVSVGAGGGSTSINAGYKSGGATSITDSSSATQLSLSGGGSAGGALTDSTAETTRTTYNAGTKAACTASGKDLYYYSNVGKTNAPVPNDLKGYGYGGGSSLYGGQAGGAGYLKITYIGN